MPVLTYKCPNCEGGLTFSTSKQKFVCEYCMSSFSQGELEENAKVAKDRKIEQPVEEGLASKQAGERGENVAERGENVAERGENVAERGENVAERGEPGEAILFSCPSCGAEVVTDATTAATSCFYCQNPIVMQGKVSGEFTPNGVIPFVVTKDKAKEAFMKWAGKRWFVPRNFFSKRQIEKITGVYFPCWIIDGDAKGSLSTQATKTNVWMQRDEIVTETRYYSVLREGDIHLEDIYKNALSKANGKLLEGVHPFKHEDTKDFSMGYLLGFQAEQRDITMESLSDEVDNDIRKYTSELLKDSIDGYKVVVPGQAKVNITKENWCYTLLPVWTLTYRGKDKKIYYYAMNGQTGKVCGKLPLDRGRVAIFFAAITAVALPIFTMIGRGFGL